MEDGGGDWRPGRKDGRQLFQHKQEIVEATPERLDLLRRFKADLKILLSAGLKAALVICLHNTY